MLRWIRYQSQFEHLPVIMLTGSEAKTDAETANLLGATAFLESLPISQTLASFRARLIGIAGRAHLASRLTRSAFKLLQGVKPSWSYLAFNRAALDRCVSHQLRERMSPR